MNEASRFVVVPPADREPCEAFADGEWRWAELGMWKKRDDGWWGNVAWQPLPGDSCRLITVHQRHLRQLTDLHRMGRPTADTTDSG